MNPDSAEFDCGCYIRITPEVTVSLWQCPARGACVGWQLIMTELERCMRQLRIHVLGRSL